MLTLAQPTLSARRSVKVFVVDFEPLCPTRGTELRFILHHRAKTEFILWNYILAWLGRS